MRLILLSFLLSAGTPAATLEWDCNPEPVAGYRVYRGFASRQYVEVIDVGNTHHVPITQTPCGITNFYAVTAYADEGLESDYSEEVWWVPECPKPDAPQMLRIVTVTNALWLERSEDLSTWWPVLRVDGNDKSFFRLEKLSTP